MSKASAAKASKASKASAAKASKASAGKASKASTARQTKGGIIKEFHREIFKDWGSAGLDAYQLDLYEKVPLVPSPAVQLYAACLAHGAMLGLNGNTLCTLATTADTWQHYKSLYRAGIQKHARSLAEILRPSTIYTDNRGADSFFSDILRPCDINESATVGAALYLSLQFFDKLDGYKLVRTRAANREYFWLKRDATDANDATDATDATDG